MRIFFDTEFHENRDGEVRLISLGAIREDGQTFYAEDETYDPATATIWLKENVVPYLTGPRLCRHDIAHRFAQFAGGPGNKAPEFWTYVGAYDWVLLCRLYGGLMQIPEKWPAFPMDIMNYLVMNGLGKWNLPVQASKKHNALNDAIWTKDCYDQLMRLKESRASS